MDENSPEVVIAIQAAIKASAVCEKIRMDLAGWGIHPEKRQNSCDHCRLWISGNHL